MNINYGEPTLGLNIEKIEEKYQAKYIGEFCLKTKSGNWSENVAAVFYQEAKARPEYSHYFGILWQQGTLMITNAESAFENGIQGVRALNGEIIFSRHVHDFRYSSDGSVFVDGGRDYLRYGCNDTVKLSQIEIVDLKIDKDKLVL